MKNTLLLLALAAVFLSGMAAAYPGESLGLLNRGIFNSSAMHKHSDMAAIGIGPSALIVPPGSPRFTYMASPRFFLKNHIVLLRSDIYKKIVRAKMRIHQPV